MTLFWRRYKSWNIDSNVNYKLSKVFVAIFRFVESQRDPAQDPLIFWFNGGPGCSSLDGLLNEMGPYVANIDGKTLRKNENAWNKVTLIFFFKNWLWKRVQKDLNYINCCYYFPYWIFKLHLILIFTFAVCVCCLHRVTCWSWLFICYWWGYWYWRWQSNKFVI